MARDDTVNFIKLVNEMVFHIDPGPHSMSKSDAETTHLHHLLRRQGLPGMSMAHIAMDRMILPALERLKHGKIGKVPGMENNRGIPEAFLHLLAENPRGLIEVGI